MTADENARPAPLDEQLTFIRRARDSHGLLVAGPGTGKTFTLVRTSEYLVEECGVDPDGIALITLTRSMAGSLRERIPYGRAQTIHSFALRHLNLMGEARGRLVADPWEVDELVRDDLRLGVSEEFAIDVTLTQISDYLDELGKAFRETQEEPRDLSDVDSQIHRVFRHQREFFRYRLMDELIVDLLELVEQGSELRHPPSHILADEYQDLNPGELRLLRAIVERHAVIVMACGDDRQSIYGFREADQLALHRFPHVYGLEEIDYLWYSSRCPQAICDFCEAVADVLPALPGIERPPLQPWPGREAQGELRVISVPSPTAETRWVLEECNRLISEEGVRPSEIMIIAASFFKEVYRNFQKEAATRSGLEFQVYDPREADPAGDQPAVRVLGAGLRLLKSADDQMAWRTLEWATPGLGEVRRRQVLTSGEATYYRSLSSVADGDAVCKKPIDAGHAVIDEFGGTDVPDGRQVLETLVGVLDCEFTSLSGVEELMERVDGPTALDEWLREIRGMAEKGLIDPSERPGDIPIRTIFGAKGLEAPVVFLVNTIEQAFSGRGSVADGVRRLYVAVSRTKRRLYITAPRFLGHTSLEYAVGTKSAGVYDLVLDAAHRAGVHIESI